jgi:6-phosphogluconolactonase
MNEPEFAVVGSYTREGGDGLSTHRVDDGSITPCDTAWEEDPSFLDVHPTEQFVVAVNERETGSAVSYRVDEDDGSLDRLDVTGTGDDGPCHVALDPTGEYAVVSHYTGGSVTLLSVSTDGALDGPLDRQEHEGSGTNDDRQAVPHPHSAWFVTDSLVYVPDLGADQVVVYELDRSAERLSPLSDAMVDCKPGAGPRHLAVHPNEPVGYLLNELDATLTVLDLTDPRSPVIEETHSTLPDDVDLSGTIAADVHVHPDGEYVFATNRGHDSIALFVTRESPLNVSQTDVRSTDGKWPRNFAIHPGGEQVFLCHQHNDNIVSFEFDSDAGTFNRIEGVTKLGSPVCLRFV